MNKKLWVQTRACNEEFYTKTTVKKLSNRDAFCQGVSHNHDDSTVQPQNSFVSCKQPLYGPLCYDKPIICCFIQGVL